MKLCPKTMASHALIYAQRILKGLAGVANAASIIEQAKKLETTALEESSAWFCIRLRQALEALIQVWDETMVATNWNTSIVTERDILWARSRRRTVKAPVHKLVLDELLAAACNCC